LANAEATVQPAKTQPSAKRQILAFGGVGLEKAGTAPTLMKYFLELAGKKTPRVCFMPSGTGDAKGEITRWNDVMKTYDCQPKVQKVYIASPSTKSFEAELLQADAIYIGGGNAVNMLAIWKVQGIDKIIRQAYDRGIVLGGEGAGSICWFEQGLTDSRPGKLSIMDCLGFLKGSNCPDYDTDKSRRPLYQDWIKKGEIKDGIAADAGVALHFVDEKLVKVVGVKANAKAYRISRTGDKAMEEALPLELLAK